MYITWYNNFCQNPDLDIKRQMRKMYDNVNPLLRKFSKCSVGVKCFIYLKLIVLVFIVDVCGSIVPKQL